MSEKFPPKHIGPRLENDGFYSSHQDKVEMPSSRSRIYDRLKNLDVNQATREDIYGRLRSLAGTEITSESLVFDLIQRLGENADDSVIPLPVIYRNMIPILHRLISEEGQRHAAIDLWNHFTSLVDQDVFRSPNTFVRAPKTKEERKAKRDQVKKKQYESHSLRTSVQANRLERKPWNN